MRLCFMRGTSIASVKHLKRGSDDEVVKQALVAFDREAKWAYDGFEVWDGKRFVYRYSAATKTGESPELKKLTVKRPLRASLNGR